MVSNESMIPSALWTYIEGLRSHDIEKIASTLADDVRFVTPAKTMEKQEIVAFLSALYRGFPDWTYAYEIPERLENDCYGVKWHQGGTHTGPLAFPGFPGVEATGISVSIPPHFFFYKIRGEALIEIRPDPIPGGAPRGIFEQIGVEMPPL
jgi:hypothetical protein